MCNLLGTAITRDFVRRTVTEQRWLMGPIALLLTYLFLVLNHVVQSGNEAWRMRGRVDKQDLLARDAVATRERIETFLQANTGDPNAEC